MARALATDPAALLMDEPFGALDRALRSELQAELVRMQENVGITTVMVTHDQEEAQAVAEQLVVMNEGRVEQVGSPEEIYDNPASLFVNGFIGHANQIPATVTGQAALKAKDGSEISVGRPLDFPRRQRDHRHLPPGGSRALDRGLGRRLRGALRPGGDDGPVPERRGDAARRHAVQGPGAARWRGPPRPGADDLAAPRSDPPASLPRTPEPEGHRHDL